MKKFKIIFFIFLFCFVINSQFSQNQFDVTVSNSKLNNFTLSLNDILKTPITDTLISTRRVYELLKAYNLDTIKKFRPKDLDSLKEYIKSNNEQIKLLPSKNESISELKKLLTAISSTNTAIFSDTNVINQETKTQNQPISNKKADQSGISPTIVYILFAGLFLFFIFLFFSLRSKIKLLMHRSESLNNEYRNVPDTSNQFRKLNDLESDLKDWKTVCNDKLNKESENYMLIEKKLNKIESELDAMKSLYANVGVQTMIKNEAVEKDINLQLEDASQDLGQMFVVEYYVDNGRVKFKKSSSGSPFYIKKFLNRSELTYNERVTASTNYAEQIQKCFHIKGGGRGNGYKNNAPAKCEYDEDLNIWTLMEMGELESV